MRHEDPGPSVYLEITKPRGRIHEENHVGRFLWAPADEEYLNGRKGKLGKLKTGDKIIHDVNGTIVGYSIVKEPAKEIDKDKLIKRLRDEGIFTDNYKKFANKWLQKSDKFYIVELSGFKELEKKIRYGKVKGLPEPHKLQEVYLAEVSPEVIDQLKMLNSAQNKIKENIPSLVNYFTSRGYYYPPHLVAQFYTALKTKGFVILSGLTGTGKTKIAQELAELLDPSKGNFLFLSVRPDWRDSKPLLGYYNPLTEQYQKTPLLDLLLRATHDYKENGKNAMPYFVLLDEMNLAHVEYYFADFLSVLESGRDENGFTRESIKLHDVEKVEREQGIPKEIKLPPNLYIIGTVNMDETTYSFSPKVLDRAFKVEFHDVELEGYPPETAGQESSKLAERLRESILNDLRGENGKFLARPKEEINKAVKELKETDYWNALKNLNQALEPYDLHFGYRVVDEIALFFKKARESQEGGIVEFKDEDEIFDLALLMKVLPKFHGNRRKLEKPLLVVLKMAKEGGLKGDEAEKGTDELWKDILGENAPNKLVERIIEELGKTGDYKYRHTARKVLRMLRQLYEIGFASFS